MRLPRRISEVIKRKDDFIARREASLGKSVVRLQSMLISKLTREIIPMLDTTGGRIRNTLRNYQLLQSIDRVYKDFATTQQLAFVSEIGDTARGLTGLNKQFFTVTMGASLPATFARTLAATETKMLTAIGIKGGKILGGGFLDSLSANTGLLTQVKSMMSQAVTAQVSTKTFIKGMNDLITGSGELPGGIESHLNRYAHDLYMTYDRAYAQSLAEETGLKYFYYIGGTVEDSRDFCVAHDGKVWTTEEAEKWPQWTPAKGVYPEGYKIKQKDKNAVPSYIAGFDGYQPLQHCGGFRCRHHIGYIMRELAEEIRPELKK
jgi:hypothetical protein